MTAASQMTAPEQLRAAPEQAPEPQLWLEPADYPNVDHLITEDDAPLDNLFVAKQQRLLVEVLYGSPLFGERGFLAEANVGVFASIHKQALVPDVFLSLDVELPPNFHEKRYRSYFIWEYGKPPDVVIEIISDLRGGELGQKMAEYARMGVHYYVIFDPARHFKTPPLRFFKLDLSAYEENATGWFPDIGIGLALWDGTYQGVPGSWLRWCYEDGSVIPTSAEYAAQATQQADQERQHAEQANQRADQATQQAEQERQRAERLRAQLRELGIEPAE
jgi:Putative restriction endonuclease